MRVRNMNWKMGSGWLRVEEMLLLLHQVSLDHC